MLLHSRSNKLNIVGRTFVRFAIINSNRNPKFVEIPIPFESDIPKKRDRVDVFLRNYVTTSTTSVTVEFGANRHSCFGFRANQFGYFHLSYKKCLRKIQSLASRTRRRRRRP